MISKKNILFIHAGAELYGADKILYILTKGLVDRNWIVSVVLPWNGKLKESLVSAGVKVLIINHGVLRRKYFTPCGLVDRLHRIVKSGISIARIVREQDIGIIHTNTSVVFAGALAAKLAKIPHVWHIHEITTRPKTVWRALSWLIPRLADRVVCVSSAVLAHLVAGNMANAAQGQVLHNGIQPMKATAEEIQSVSNELALSKKDVIVGMVGRVNGWKGQMVLADAAELILSRCPNVRFLFVGGTFSGEEHLLISLRKRVNTGLLTDKITVLEFRNDVSAIMSNLDIFVLPSTQPDPLPTVVLEAMSLGCPVVGFAHGGICEMVANNKTGILVTPCDITEMANAIERLVNDESLRRRYGEAGRLRFNESFSIDTFLDKFESVYKNIINH
ncbi:glycosyltransferase family 4 protein [bacterium]|nr:glycosyltransferase family 4 protein [bacterium]